jgi:hypothetical protein
MKSTKLEILVDTLLNDYPAFGGNKQDLGQIQSDILNASHELFFNIDINYRKFSEVMGFKESGAFNLSEGIIPFLPSDYFKWFSHSSIKNEQRILVQSSGTSNTRSTVSLNLKNTYSQRIALSKILTHFLGADRKHLFLIGESLSEKKGLISTSDIAARGIALAASKIHRIGREPVSANLFKSMLREVGDKQFILFGMTYEILLALKENILPKGVYENMIVVHGGGWKKLFDSRLEKSHFYSLISEAWGTKRIHDYYGMAEQAGTIFFECVRNNYHVSNYSSIIVRDAGLEVSSVNETGVLNTLSFIQTSYPGVSILTQDLGKKISSFSGDCQCGTIGPIIRIEGRINEAGIKGCSDSLTL